MVSKKRLGGHPIKPNFKVSAKNKKFFNVIIFGQTAIEAKTI